MALSKSRYTTFCQCPKALWLKVNNPDAAETEDEALQARFAQGTEVGKLAQKLLGPSQDVTTHKEDDSLDYQKMIELTRQYMAAGVENICEASFSYEWDHRVENITKIDTDEPFVKCWKESHYCAVDILRKEKGGWAIYEVKSTSFPEFEGQEAKLEKYAPDIAYQKWVLTQCGVNVTGTYLVCLNSNYERQGDLDITQLFAIKDMSEMVTTEIQKVPARVSQAMKVLDSADEPGQDLGTQCNKPYHCAFWKYCSAHLPQPSVFDIYGGNFSSKKEDTFYISEKLKYYHAGKISFADLKNEPLGHIQRLQVEGKEYIDKENIRRFLDTLQYPLYFLDYETMQDAVPQYDGAKPYQQITFQYSLHIKKSETEPFIHLEHLGKSDGSDPRRKLAEQLCQDIPVGACVLAYNKKFEECRTNELAALYPDLRVHLLDIAGNIKDLLEPFQAGYYYLPAMGGSFSIKSVLPALFPNDPALDYHNLDERCQNGGHAMTIFPLIQTMEPEEAAASREALLRYCELDTWAMVKVWEKLKEVVK